MKFIRKVETNPETSITTTTKTYMCPVCGYKFQTISNGGEEIVTSGDESFILFPFFSLASLDRTTKEVCECPKCTSIQAIEYVWDGEDANEMFN